MIILKNLLIKKLNCWKYFFSGHDNFYILVFSGFEIFRREKMNVFYIISQFDDVYNFPLANCVRSE